MNALSLSNNDQTTTQPPPNHNLTTSYPLGLYYMPSVSHLTSHLTSCSIHDGKCIMRILSPPEPVDFLVLGFDHGLELAHPLLCHSQVRVYTLGCTCLEAGNALTEGGHLEGAEKVQRMG